MPDILQVGPFALNANMLIYIFSLIVGLLIMRLRLRGEEYDPKPVFDLMLSNVLIIVLFWKFSSILFMPSIIWTKPLQILMLTGTWKEVLLGVGAACIYTFFKIRKLDISLMVLLDLIAFGILSAVLSNSLLSWQYGIPTAMPWGISLTDPNYHYHPISMYYLLISVALLLWLWRASYKLGRGRILQDFLIYYGIGLWGVSLFKVKTESFFMISAEQMAYTLMIVLGIGFQYIIRKISTDVD